MSKRFEIERATETPTRLFVSFNTAKRPLYVLAKDHDTALNIAWAAGHIRHTDNGLTGDDRMMHECRSIKSEFASQDWKAVEQAAGEGRQGVIDLSGDQIHLGDSRLT